MKSKSFLLSLLTCGILLSASLSVWAQGTAFTYQGRLNVSGTAANGSYDFLFSLMSGSTGGSALTTATTNGVAVSNGLFTVTIDFGNSFPAATRWLEIAARTNNAGSFITLLPRQQITPTPYAILAEGAASANSVAAANITGTLLNASLPASPTFSGNVTAGTFSGNGGGVTNIPLTSLNTGGLLDLTSNNLSFVFKGTYPTGTNPVCLIAATNLSGLGRVDLATANQNENSLTVFANVGNGAFSVMGTYPVGAGPRAVIAADVNGDTKLDLISANVLTNTLTVLTNNGSGVFNSNATLVVGPAPASVVAADLYNRGLPDLICANSGTNTLTIYTNNSHGVFTLNQTITVGFYPTNIVAADINGDGKPDLICANFGTNTLTVLINNGNGTFFPTTITVGNNPSVLLAANLNSDNFKDLAVGNSGDSSISILTNNGNGSFTLASTLDSHYCLSLAAADFNADGKLDLVSVDGSLFLNVLVNNGGGLFTTTATMMPLLTNGYPVTYSSVVAADLNGDGRPDIMAAVPSYYYYYFINSLVELINVNLQPSAEITLPGQSGGLRLSYGLDGAPNMIGGSSANAIASGISGGVIAGGGDTSQGNFVYGDNSSIGGGLSNSVGAVFSAIAGGSHNSITPAGLDPYYGEALGGSFIGGGLNNTIVGGGYYGGDGDVIGGGYNNLIDLGCYAAVIGGGSANMLHPGSGDSVIAGGGNNSVTGYNSIIGGGLYNVVVGDYSVIPGGGYNNVAGNYSFAAGYSAHATNAYSFVWSDGQTFYSTNNNSFNVRANGGVRFVSDGGSVRFINENGIVPGMVVDGPGAAGHMRFRNYLEIFPNQAQTSAGGMDIRATNGGVTIALNGANGTITASNVTANSFTGNGSGLTGLTTGQLPANVALLNASQTFTGTDTFTNGFTVNTGAGTLQVVNEGGLVPGIIAANSGGNSGHLRIRNAVEVFPNVAGTSSGSVDIRNTNGVTVSLNGANGAIICSNVTANGVLLTSDRNAKENFSAISSREVLAKVAALPMTEWNYKTDATARHVGPMAQDFQAAFHLSEDDKHISLGDEGGVALAAIQGLNEKLDEKQSELEALQTAMKTQQAENTKLKAQLDRLEQLVQAQAASGK